MILSSTICPKFLLANMFFAKPDLSSLMHFSWFLQTSNFQVSVTD